MESRAGDCADHGKFRACARFLGTGTSESTILLMDTEALSM